VLDVGIVLQRKHRDRVVEWVDDPILRNCGFCIVERFFLGITRGLVGAHDLDHQICAAPILVLTARIISP
jgi:hypothetical protein